MNYDHESSARNQNMYLNPMDLVPKCMGKNNPKISFIL